MRLFVYVYAYFLEVYCTFSLDISKKYNILLSYYALTVDACKFQSSHYTIKFLSLKNKFEKGIGIFVYIIVHFFLRFIMFLYLIIFLFISINIYFYAFSVKL